jgi:hypothetical protein
MNAAPPASPFPFFMRGDRREEDQEGREQGKEKEKEKERNMGRLLVELCELYGSGERGGGGYDRAVHAVCCRRGLVARASTRLAPPHPRFRGDGDAAHKRIAIVDVCDASNDVGRGCFRSSAVLATLQSVARRLKCALLDDTRGEASGEGGGGILRQVLRCAPPASSVTEPPHASTSTRPAAHARASTCGAKARVFREDDAEAVPAHAAVHISEEEEEGGEDRKEQSSKSKRKREDSGGNKPKKASGGRGGGVGGGVSRSDDEDTDAPTHTHAHTHSLTPTREARGEEERSGKERRCKESSSASRDKSTSATVIVHPNIWPSDESGSVEKDFGHNLGWG